ncbi:APC family permease [Nocardioides sp. NPDC057772]|uniref:APC family permease n=1 Tax=Nocardioides sp. NPDC057772 TaxID=3346245 RepID=UPI0036735037
MTQTNQPTALAAEQQSHLRKTLRRFDIVFLLIAAVVGLETLGQVSLYGAEAFTWALVLAVFFLVPYGLIFAETGAAFSEEGGAYTWVRDAFGRPAAAVAAILTWITQPVWVGGSMAFLAAETVSVHITPLEHGSVGDYVFKIVFIWITVVAAIASLSKGKWLPTSGAILKVGLLAFFVLTTIIYATKNGVVGLSGGDFNPTLLGLFGSVPILLFAYLGFESSNSAAGEMENPARDVPVSIFRSCATAAVCYLVPIFAILLVVPSEDITGIGGLLDAVGTVYSVYGPAAEPLLTLTAVVFVYILMSQGAAWMIISDRMQAMTAADGSFFGGFFGRFHEGLGTPVRVNMLSGVVATAFLLVAMQVTGDGASIFGVVLTISISTFLLSYLLVIPAAIRLRTRYPDRPRPFRVPVSDRGFALLGWLAFAWILLGSWVAVFPGTLERLFGEAYPFEEIWGVSQLTFEVFTLGTLGFLLLLCAVGYVRGARVRAEVGAPVPSVPTEEPTR